MVTQPAESRPISPCVPAPIIQARQPANDLSFGFSVPVSLPNEPRFNPPPSLNDAIAKFRDDAARAGLALPQHIVADGDIHRFSTNGKHTGSSGWYALHMDSLPHGAFGDWRTGLSQPWCYKDRSQLSPNEQETFDRQQEEIKRKRDEARAHAQSEAARVAVDTWEQLPLARSENPYLKRKNVGAHGVREIHGDMLVVPMRDVDGVLHNSQTIYPNGDKQFLKDARKKGCFHAIGTLNGAKVIAIAEGYATAATVHEASHLPTVVAFDAGNLLPVAADIHAKYPNARIIICGDDDVATKDNPGATKAAEAARSVGGVAVLPDFGPDRPAGVSDFNDLASLRGSLGDVARIIDGATRGAVDKPRERKQPVKLKFVLPIDKSIPTHLISGYVPFSEVTLFGGHGGAGKTTCACVVTAFVAEHVAPASKTHFERQLWGHDVRAGKVLFVTLEDTAADIREKLLGACVAYGLNTDLVLENVEVLDYSDEADNALACEEGRILVFTDAMEDIEAAAQGKKLVVIDNASDGFDADANSPRLVKKFMRRLKLLARKNRCGVLLLAHIDKAGARNGTQGNSYGGTAQWHNSARSRLALVKTDEAGRMRLVHEKANKSKESAPVELVQADDGIPMPTDIREETSVDGDLLRCLESAIARGEIISTSRQGPGNAFSVAQTLPDYPKALHTAKQFWSAVGRLTAAGSLIRTEYTNAQRKQREKFTFAQVAQVVR